MPVTPRLFAAVLALPLCLGIARAEDAVLLSSTAPGYAAGMVVLETDRLSVPEGASLTLLFQSGEVLRLGGPFNGTIQPPASAGATTSVARLADLFKAQGTDASVIGGTRSVRNRGREADPDDVLVDPRRSGTYCIGPSTSVWIARPDQERPAVALRRKGSSRTLAWPADATRVEWPGDVPLDDGSQFELETGGQSRATVTFRTMPPDSAGGSSRLASGIMLGCQDQFEPELRKLALSVVPPEVWITTDRGRQPKYQKGKPVALTVTSSVDGYLYCVSRADDGAAMAIFPAGSVNGAQLQASSALNLPGRRQPTALTAGPELRQVQCWLADRNISAELPNALIAGPSRRLPERVASDLDGMFARVGGTRIATASLAIETE